jgi:hypothetical protein
MHLPCNAHMAYLDVFLHYVVLNVSHIDHIDDLHSWQDMIYGIETSLLEKIQHIETNPTNNAAFKILGVR